MRMRLRDIGRIARELFESENEFEEAIEHSDDPMVKRLKHLLLYVYELGGG